MVFSTKNNATQLAETIRSVDPFKVSASIIRRELESYDLDLNDKLCDSEELRESLTKMEIPKMLLNNS